MVANYYINVLIAGLILLSCFMRSSCVLIPYARSRLPYRQKPKAFHLGISSMPSRSTLSDANQRRPEVIFESIYRDLYATYRHVLSSDSRKKQGCCLDEAFSRLLDSTYYHTVLQSAVQGRGPSVPKPGQKERGYKKCTPSYTPMWGSPFLI